MKEHEDFSRLAYQKLQKQRRRPITAIWLRRIGDKVQVLVEIEKVWRLAIEECDGSFSHIAEHTNPERWPVDTVTER